MAKQSPRSLEVHFGVSPRTFGHSAHLLCTYLHGRTGIVSKVGSR